MNKIIENLKRVRLLLTAIPKLSSNELVNQNFVDKMVNELEANVESAISYIKELEEENKRLSAIEREHDKMVHPPVKRGVE